jgi:ParB/RepB/Spo0J family partition protein
MSNVFSLLVAQSPVDIQWDKARSIPIEKIKVDPSWNSRSGDLDVSSLKASIEEIGLMQPIVVTREHQLIAGFRRFEACRQLGISTVPAVIVEADADLARRYNLAENLARKSLRLYDTMRVVHDLSDKKGVKSSKIARDIGINQSRVEMISRVWPRLSQTLKSKWSEIPEASWEPTLHQLTEWSTLSWSEQNAEWKNWSNDESDTSEPYEEGEEAYGKPKKSQKTRRKVADVRSMIETLWDEKTDISRAQVRALKWALGERNTL